jgi:hypothetical protein
MNDYSAGHELVCDDSECKEVDGVGVTGLAYDLWGHVSRGATGIFSVIGLHLS